jgi:hypothetical protein
MTIFDATVNGSVVCLMGDNRGYCIGDIAYRFSRQSPCPYNPDLAMGVPVMWVDGAWVRETQLAKRINREWTAVVTILD